MINRTQVKGTANSTERETLTGLNQNHKRQGETRSQNWTNNRTKPKSQRQGETRSQNRTQTHRNATV